MYDAILMPNKPQERFLVREYKKHLIRKTGLPASFRTNRFDPPDFWLTHGEQRRAVEVTKIIHERDRNISQAQWGLVYQAEREAMEAGILSGRYVVAFRDPWVERRQKSDFKQHVLEFVKRTRNEERTTRNEVVIRGKSLGDIEKYAATGAKIYPFGGGLNALGGYVDDLRDQLLPILDRAIKAKARKMAAYQPASLVLYDLYWLADISVFTACVRAVPEARYFKDIYVVQDIGRGFSVSFDLGVDAEQEAAAINGSRTPSSSSSASRKCSANTT